MSEYKKNLILGILRSKNVPIKKIFFSYKDIFEDYLILFYDKKNNNEEILAIQRMLRSVTNFCMKHNTDRNHFILHLWLKDESRRT